MPLDGDRPRALSRRGDAHERLRRRDRRRPGRRRLDRAAPGPGRPPRGGPRALPGRLGHRLHPRVDARPACSSCPAGACSPRWSRPGPRRSAASPSTTRTARAPRSRCDPAPASTRSTRRAGTCSTACSSNAATASGADVLHETPVAGLLRDDDGRVLGVRASGRRGRARSRSGRDSRSVPTASGRSSRARSGARSVSRGRAASAILYRYVDRRPLGRLRLGVRRRGGGRPDPDQRRRDVRLRGHHTAADADAAAPRRARLPSTVCSTRSPPRCPTSSARAAPTGRAARLARRAGLRPPLLRPGLGPGRRRRLLQGPDHHPRAHRCAAGRGAAVGRRAREAAGVPPGGRAGAVPGHPRPAVAARWSR